MSVAITNLKQINFDTPLKEDDVTNITKIITDIKSHPDSFIFDEPVRYLELGLLDYIPHPM